MPKPNPTLTEIFRKSPRICSLEISYHRPVDYRVLQAIPCSFCSVIWIGNFDQAPAQIAPLVMAKELIDKGFTVILHFPGRNNTRDSSAAVLDYAKEIGIRNLLVVRGATPECNIADKKYDFPHSCDALKFIKERYGDYFDLCIGGYPYRHPDSKDLEDDMKFLKEKNDAGAKFIVTQAAFSFDVYRNFLDNCRKHDINMRIIPGVYVIRSFVDFTFLQKLCKVPQSDPVVEQIRKMQGNEKQIAEFGVKASLETVSKLLADKDFCPPHIYTMGELDAIKDFFQLLKT